MAEQLGLGTEMVPPASIWRALPGPIVGIDAQTTRVSLAMLAPGYAGPMAFTLSLDNTGSSGARAWKALAALVPWLQGHALEVTPVAIALETVNPKATFGNKQPQLEMLGIVKAALWRVWPAVEVVEVFPNSWKAAALGKGQGHAKKPAVVAWARVACGWEPGPTAPDDEADALGVATWMALKVVGSR